MSIVNKFLGRRLLLAIASLALAAPVLAAPATVITNVNVRSGPGATYPVADILVRGDLVEVDRCDYGWCYVRYGHQGWIDETLLLPSPAPQRYGFARNTPRHVDIYIPSYVVEQETRRHGHDGQNYGVDTRSAW